MLAGAEAGALSAEDGIEDFSDEQAWDVVDDIPNDSAAALILLEATGPCRCTTPSPAPAGLTSATASSAPST